MPTVHLPSAGFAPGMGARASRRTLLAGVVAVGGAGTAGALAGCTSRPTEPPTTVVATSAGITVTQVVTPTAPGVTPTAMPGALEAQAAELVAAGVFAASAKARGAAPAFVQWARAAQAACLAHAATLAASDPLGGHPNPTPTAPVRPVPASQAAAQKAIATLRQQQGVRYRALCGSAADGSTALLWASLAVTASVTSAPGPAVTASASTDGPQRVDTGTRADALAVLDSRLGQAIQGFQVGMGLLPVGDARWAPSRDRLQALQTLRAQVEQQILRASATPSAGTLRDAMPGLLDTVAHAQTTWGRLELLLLDAWGRVLAASSGSDRQAALAQMVAQAGLAASRGVGVDTWPGWV